MMIDHALNLPSEDFDGYEVHFLIDEDHHIRHLLMPIDFLYDQLWEREELFIELKKRIKDYEWQNRKGIS